MDRKDKESMWSIFTLVMILFAETILFCTWGFDYLTITWGICIPLSITVISYGLYCMYDTNDGMLLGFSSGIIIFVLIVMMVVTVCIHFDAVSLPHRYNAACDTIEQTKELLLKYEQNSSFANGLEALQLKQSLKDAIDKRNDLKADIDGWLANPFMPYKDILKNDLN